MMTATMREYAGTVNQFRRRPAGAVQRAELCTEPRRAGLPGGACAQERLAALRNRLGRGRSAALPYADWTPHGRGVGGDVWHARTVCLHGARGRDEPGEYRLEGLNKRYGTSILASEDLHAAAGPGFEWRRLDRVVVVGRSAPTPVTELSGEVGAVADDVLRARDYYEAALEAYFARRFDVAIAGFRDAAALVPATRRRRRSPSARSRCTSISPGPEWDGAYVATTK